jgi:malate dehydrogenase
VTLVGGAGGVGSCIAFNLLGSPREHEVVLVDSRPEMVSSHVMDLENAAALGAAAGRVRGGVPRDALDADVVALCAAAPLRLNSSRTVYLAENRRIVAQALAPLREAGFGGVVLVLTNPVDHLATWVHRQGWLPRRQILGYGLNDSLRLRTAVGAALGVHPRAVDAWVLGEHGAGQVPLYSRIRVHGEPVTLTGPQRAAAQEYINTWYVRHVALDSGRTSTWSTGLGAARLIDAMCQPPPAGDAPRTAWPVSAVLDGAYGIEGVCLGVPVALCPAGVDQILEWDLAPEELSALRSAARRVAAAVEETDGS